MRWCCPPNHGCNAPGQSETCAVDLCRAAASGHPEAALALDRWSIARDAQGGERRFRRRAYQRARDRALIALAMSTPADAESALTAGESATYLGPVRRERRRGHRPRLAHPLRRAG